MSTSALAVVSAGLQLDAGILAAGSASASAAAVEAQGRIAAVEAESAARDVEREGEAKRGAQAMAYTANGVRLTGSPLLVMAQTAINTEIEADSLRRQGVAKLHLAEATADNYRSAILSSLITGVSGAAQTAGLYVSRKNVTPDTKSTAPVSVPKVGG